MTSAVQAWDHDTTSDAGTCRVAVREIREAAWRALYAAGASAGEAAVAAAAVAFAEVVHGQGLQALLAELPTVPAARTPVATCSRDGVDALEDPASRGLLLLAPLGIGLLVARTLSPPVLLPAVGWHPVLAGLLVPHCRPAEPALVASEVDEAGNVLRGLRVWPDRSIELLDGGQLDELGVPTGRGTPARAGVLLTTAPRRAGTEPRPAFPAAVVAELQRRAHVGGVLVDGDLWSAVQAAAGRYLVAER
jgi:hypothetical protein